jgi:hypothetical protein
MHFSFLSNDYALFYYNRAEGSSDADTVQQKTPIQTEVLDRGNGGYQIKIFALT